MEKAIKAAKAEGDTAPLIRLAREDGDAGVRAKAVRAMCPCRVRDDVRPVWDAIFARAADPDPRVRLAVLHTICDGSPARLEDKAREVVDGFTRDKDSEVRRLANRVMASVLRGGPLNIL
jgi:hypothetical protein